MVDFIKMVTIAVVGFGAFGIAISFLLYAFSPPLTRANFTFQATHLLFIHLIDQPARHTNRPDLRITQPPDQMWDRLNSN
jgi:hypothetical protein